MQSLNVLILLAFLASFAASNAVTTAKPAANFGGRYAVRAVGLPSSLGAVGSAITAQNPAFAGLVHRPGDSVPGIACMVKKHGFFAVDVRRVAEACDAGIHEAAVYIAMAAGN